MNQHAPVRHILYLGVQPTPYTQYLLENLRRSEKFTLEVFYTFQGISDLPWKNNFLHPSDRFLDRKMGIDLDMVKRAWRDKDSMFYVLGYNEPTKFLVLLARVVRGYPYSYFNDSIKLNHNVYHYIKKAVLPRLLGKVKAVFTTGNFGVDRFQRSGYCSPDCNIVNFPFFVPLPELKAREVSNTVTFLCSGRLVDRKGFDDVIEALHLCKRDHNASFKLRIAGAGPNEQQLRDLVEQYQLEDHIEFLGWLEPYQLKDVMQASDVFIHYVPILDPFPVAVLDAMSFGLPVIGSDQAGSVADRVEDGVNGYVLPPNEPTLLAEAILKFINDPASAIRMGQASRRAAEEWPVERAEQILETHLW